MKIVLIIFGIILLVLIVIYYLSYRKVQENLKKYQLLNNKTKKKYLTG